MGKKARLTRRGEEDMSEGGTGGRGGRSASDSCCQHGPHGHQICQEKEWKPMPLLIFSVKVSFSLFLIPEERKVDVFLQIRSISPFPLLLLYPSQGTCAFCEEIVSTL